MKVYWVVFGMSMLSCLDEYKIPPVKCVPSVSDEGEGLEELLTRVRGFLLLHAQIDVSDAFLSPIRSEKLMAEFSKLCRENERGILLDLYTASVILLFFCMAKNAFYKLDKDFVRKITKTVCYILDHEKKIIQSYSSAEEFHRKMAELCASTCDISPQCNNPQIVQPNQIAPIITLASKPASEPPTTTSQLTSVLSATTTSQPAASSTPPAPALVQSIPATTGIASAPTSITVSVPASTTGAPPASVSTAATASISTTPGLEDLEKLMKSAKAIC